MNQIVRPRPIIAFFLIPLLPAVASAESIDYGRDILPILTENCFACHGPDEAGRKAGLRLDTFDGATADLGGYAALVPGQPGESELVYRIETSDPLDIMPPPDAKLKMTGEERRLLRQWIAQGGEYSEHWAFVPPAKPSLPQPGKHPVDAFVHDRLAREELSPSPPAAPEVLARRLFIDLIGLPPTPAEVDRFVAAHTEDPDAAAANAIKDLLARPAFGEKWARHWLDVARYADSNGFEKDLPREQWAWRDWVIDAINRDMPYDQFVVEQVAGDLIPNRTQDQIVASGFVRNGMVNEEGAIVYEQFRIEGIFDRMDAVGKAFLGLSLQCAQCHTHKYDPITHDEYFGMFAFFNQAHESQSWVYTDDQLAQIQEVRHAVTKQETRLRDQIPDWQSHLATWTEAQTENATAWTVLEVDDSDWHGGLNHPEILEDQSVLVLGHPSLNGRMHVTGTPALDGVTALRLEALRYGDLPHKGPGRSHLGTFILSELEVFTKTPDDDSEWQPVKLKRATADFSEPEKPLEAFWANEKKDPKGQRKVGPVAFLIDGDKETGWRTDRGPVLRHTDSVAVIEFEEPLHAPEGTEFQVKLHFEHGGDTGRTTQLGRMRLSTTRDPAPAAPPYDHAATRALRKPSGARTAEDRAAIFTAWRLNHPEAAAINETIAALEEGYPEAETSVLHPSKATEFDRVTRLLDRGVWNQPKHAVEPHVPAALHPLEAQDPSRLDFARWLASADSPLVARVHVNRVWQTLFGTGLVETPEDFGTRVPRPVYLELLDWLSVDFMENGWSMKHLLTTIASSQTYQQTAGVTPEHLERDPKNQLLARATRFRADAEVLRDVALSAAGLLHEEIGGPSIYPPVPESVLNYNFTKPDYWDPPTSPERYRRALYLFRKRSMPDPVLTTLDAPNADFSCVRRIRSNTPLASLVSLNEPIFVEAAQGMALRVIHEGGSTDESRVNFAYRLCTSRSPNPNERQAVLAFLDEQRARLGQGWISIQDVSGKAPADLPSLPNHATPQDLAAWTLASRVLLNLDEALAKP